MTLGVVLVNFKGADDTIECLESILRSSIPLEIAVVDNNSADGSVEKLLSWAAGRYSCQAASDQLSRLSLPALPKPLSVALPSADKPSVVWSRSAFSLIESPINGGFAAGNNIGIKHLLRSESVEFIWLLNNDTVVEHDAAEKILAKMQSSERIGMCGTTVKSYHNPDVIQALGGHQFNWLLGSSVGIGSGLTSQGSLATSTIEAATDFVTGASLAVSKKFLEAVGLMEEDYFLYFEEIDWAVRNRNRFQIGFEPAAVVYHKEGSAIGSSSRRGQRSEASEFYLMRSKLIFIKRHRPLLLPIYYLLSVLQILTRISRLQPGKARTMTRALFGLSLKPRLIQSQRS